MTWDFGGVAIAGFILTAIFWFTFKHIDKEEYVLSTNPDYNVGMTGTIAVVGENEKNASSNEPRAIAENEEMMISPKQ